MILTFELTPEKDELEIFFDKEGQASLTAALQAVGDTDPLMAHLHLKSSEWGGDELSSEVMHQGNALLHHVKIVML